MRNHYNDWLLVGALGALGSCADSIAQDSIFFENVAVFDGQRKIDLTNVFIDGGMIKAVGKEVKAPDGSKRINGQGKTLMPGMIDSHAHV